MSVKLRYGMPLLAKIYMGVYLVAICWLLVKSIMGDKENLTLLGNYLKLSGLDIIKLRIILAGLAVLNFVLFLEVLQRTRLGWYVLIIPYIISFIFISFLLLKLIIAISQRDINLLTEIGNKKFFILGAFGLNLFIVIYFASIRQIFDN